MFDQETVALINGAPPLQGLDLDRLPCFEKLLPRWMSGETLVELERKFGTAGDRVGYCEKAREFVLRIVPELSYLYGLLPQLYKTLFPMATNPPIALATIGAAVREGFDIPEKVALRSVLGRRLNRRAIHAEYFKIASVLFPGPADEAFIDLRNRIDLAVTFSDIAGETAKK